MPVGSRKVTKKEWDAAGGFSNPRCWRRMKSGSWEHYIRND